jgi:hypothetical protein
MRALIDGSAGHRSRAAFELESAPEAGRHANRQARDGTNRCRAWLPLRCVDQLRSAHK